MVVLLRMWQLQSVGGDGMNIRQDKLDEFADKLEQLGQQPAVSGVKILLLMEEYGHHFGWTVSA